MIDNTGIGYIDKIGYIVGASVKGSQLVVESWTSPEGLRYGVTHVDKPEQASKKFRATIGGVEIFDVTIEQGTKFLVSVPATGRETLFSWNGHELIELAHSTFDNGDGFEAEIYDSLVEVHTREEWEVYLEINMMEVYYEV